MVTDWHYNLIKGPKGKSGYSSYRDWGRCMGSFLDIYRMDL